MFSRGDEGIVEVASGTAQMLEDPGPGTGSPAVLVVTRMWPSEADRFRNGFVAAQVDALRGVGACCDVLVAQGRSGIAGYAEIAGAVRRAVGSRRYDVVHAHYGLTGVAAGLQARCPLVVTFHGSDVFGEIDAEGHRTLKGRIEPILSRAAGLRARANVAVSSRLAEQLRPLDTHVIPVGIDDTLFAPQDRVAARRRLGLDATRPYVLFVGDPARPVKRFWLAKQAVDGLRASYPDVELITVRGRPLEEIPVWMNAADVLIITSAYEGGPLVHKEAMACNLPVVTVDVGDVRERLAGVRHCRVVADAADELSAALASVLVRRERSDGREHLEGLTAGSVAHSLLQLYGHVAR